MAAQKKRCVEVEGPFDLLLTMRTARLQGGDPAFQFEPDGLWQATWTPQGSATLRLRQLGDRVEACAWGEGADWALDRLPDLIGLRDVDAADFAPTEEPLRSLARRFAGLRAPRTHAVVEALLPVIVAQKVAGKEAASSYRLFVLALGETAPGPKRELRLPPPPERVAKLSYEDLHRFGIERARALRMIRAASHARRLEEVVEMAPADRWVRLEALPGLGPWTAGKVLWSVCGDPDAVVIGDYNLPSWVSWNLVGEPRSDDRRMLHLLEPYRGQRGRVLRLLELGGRHPPRFGPRHALRQIANA